MMPVLFLLIFATIFGNDTIDTRGNIKTSTYYVPGLITLGVVSTTFVNLAMALVVLRENRVLKRMRGTPLPAWVFLAGRVAVEIGMAIALTVVLVADRRAALRRDRAGLDAAWDVPGARGRRRSFCALGIAFSSVIPNEDAAPAMVNALVLPLYFISGVFFPVDEAPKWLTDLASLFPVRHLAEALLDAFDPRTTGAGIDWGHLGVVAAWGVAGALIALFTFRWTPKGE